MPMNQPAEEKVVDNLEEALARLRDDMTRVEVWAGALSCFAKPIPEYDPKQHNYALPPAGTKPPRTP
jgi:hypothetical protein